MQISFKSSTPILNGKRVLPANTSHQSSAVRKQDIFTFSGQPSLRTSQNTVSPRVIAFIVKKCYPTGYKNTEGYTLTAHANAIHNLLTLMEERGKLPKEELPSKDSICEILQSIDGVIAGTKAEASQSKKKIDGPDAKTYLKTRVRAKFGTPVAESELFENFWLIYLKLLPSSVKPTHKRPNSGQEKLDRARAIDGFIIEKF